MAEQVQAALDAMVPPLLDLQDRQVFTPKEIKAILAQRRESEYALRRRHVRKSDYIQYIQHEVKLEQLRTLRTKRIKKQQRREQPSNDTIQAQQPSGFNSKHIGDKHFIQHLHLLWKRTLQKFPNDLSLLLQYIDFCKTTKSFQKLTRAYAMALQCHGKATTTNTQMPIALWIEAASHEWFAKHNMSSARVLLQRGIRINPNAYDLYVQYFTLELHFVQFLQGRQQQLLQSSDDSEDSSDDDQDNKQELPSSSSADHTLAKLVLDHAMRAIAKDSKATEMDRTQWALQFLDTCRQFPRTQALQTYILHDILGTTDTKDGTHDDKTNKTITTRTPLAWIAKANHVLPTSKDLRPVLQVLQQATQQVPTQDMYQQAIHFLQEIRQEQQLVKDDESEDDEDENARDIRDQQCVEFLTTLYERASKADFYSTTLALDYADHVLEVEGDEEDGKEAAVKKAVAILSAFVDKCRSQKSFVEAKVWVQWAGLEFSPSEPELAQTILQRGLDQTPIDREDHLILFLQLIGTTVRGEPSKESSSRLQRELEKVLLLYPGFTDMDVIDYSPFDIQNVSDACLESLRFVLEGHGLVAARKLASMILFRSGFVQRAVSSDLPGLKRFFDTAIDMEVQSLTAEGKKHLLRVLDLAIKIFADSTAEDEYCQRRDDLIHGRGLEIKEDILIEVPTLDVTAADFSPEAFQTLYQCFQVVRLKNTEIRGTDSLSWQDIGAVFKQLSSSDAESFCIETKGTDLEYYTPSDFLAPTLTSSRAYCSFLVQKDLSVFKMVLGRLPVSSLPGTQYNYEPALWIFFGRNPRGNESLEGRPEHTDSVSHDGTWHYQLSGRKDWTLRPSSDLLKHFAKFDIKFGSGANSRLRVTCQKGDVIVLNTRLWFHQTNIPPQWEPSVSYARDFRREKVAPDTAGGMQNVDGLYATNDIQAGTIVFTEDDMPDAELHRSSTNPNCEVVDLNGGHAVVSTRAIRAGEFFCVPESDQEMDSEEEVEDESG